MKLYGEFKQERYLTVIHQRSEMRLDDSAHAATLLPFKRFLLKEGVIAVFNTEPAPPHTQFTLQVQ